MKSRFASVIFVVLVLLPVSLALCVPAASAGSRREVLLYSFNGTDGGVPTTGVIQGRDGNFYGTTNQGGTNGVGTVFTLTPSGTLTTVYSFCSQANCPDGESPFGGVIQGSDGNFYGTTNGGGANPNGVTGGPGTVFKLTPSGKLTTLYSFCSRTDCADGHFPYAGVIQGSDGNFYGTTLDGGANFDPASGIYGGTVFKLTPSGTLTTLYSFCSQASCSDGWNPFAGVIQGRDGNLYGTTIFGGANGASNGGYGTMFRITPSGTLTTLHSFCSQSNCADGAWPEAGLIQGSDGNFYGTTRSGGASSHRIKRGPGTVFMLTPSGALTTLHRFCRKAHCTDGQDPIAGLIQGSDGNFYGTTFHGGAKPDGVTVGPGTVFKLTPSGTLTTLYSFCSAFDRKIPSCLDGILPDASLIRGSDGNIYGTTLGGGTNDDGTVFELRRRDTSR